MISNKEIEQWFNTIPVSEFSGVDAGHVYAMAEIAYKKGIEDAANKCEQRASSLPHGQCSIARQCRLDVLSLLPTNPL